MFKNFVSNTLLSVVVDKKARDKMNAVNKRKSIPTSSDDELDIPRMVPEKNAVPKSSLEQSAISHQPAHLQENDPEVLIHEALESTEEELLRKQSPAHMDNPITPERAALIEHAMAIRRSKLYILDELTQDQRDKLTYMAMQALNDQVDK